MSLLALRRQPLGFVLLALVFAFSGRLSAELVWASDTGWKVEGGVLSGLGPTDSKNALELMNKARAAEERESTGSAIRAYNKVGKKFSNSVYAPEALYRSAKLRLTQKKYSKAFDTFQNVISRYPNTPRFNEIIGEQYRIASALLDGARGKFLWIFPGFTNREKSVEYFEVILFNAPYSDYAPLALMNIARAHQKFDNTDYAIDALDRLINNYPQSVLTPDAYLKLAQAHAGLVDGPYYDQESSRQAITYFEDFMILYPSDNNVADAEKGLSTMKNELAESKMKIGDFYFYKRDNFKAARVLYNEAITAYPDSAIAARAKVRLTEVVAAEEKAAAKNADPKKKKRFFFF
ncbi:outer membrane protein assembly factor BamD [Nibricoccus aquaticus]|uniref:Outer membrane protein assembly factor BamD n=1 Tax=Nibricoccus aquaticus TaxID=2576891 RepID=A0A290QGA1_9BACT|nr:outer membrane protein assembly factor BamD [Nibricoccus aquaticus]ATC62912.1 outer membrane protein assembly factor BamD [Nibricoccus aquaticus]